MNKAIGIIGEELSVRYLVGQGYHILDRNFRTKFGELDIIARKDKLILFIEVKTRTSNTYGIPSESIHFKKQKTIRKLSQQYILQKKLNDEDLIYRYDAIEVRIKDKKYKINHIANAF